MRKVVITDSGVLALPLGEGQEKQVKLTCPYSIRQCRTNCAYFWIDNNEGQFGTVKCRQTIPIGELG